MYKKEHVLHLLHKIEMTLERIIENSKEIDSYHFYYLTSAGMERLESTCMLLCCENQFTGNARYSKGDDLICR